MNWQGPGDTISRAVRNDSEELFDGLAIQEMEKEWKAYPILHLDLNFSSETRNIDRWIVK